MDSSQLHNLLSYLQGLQETWDSDPEMKDIVERIKMKIVHLISEWPVDVSGDPRSTPTAPQRLVFPNLEKLMYIKSEMERMYSVAFKCSRSINCKCSKDVLIFISRLSKDLEDILSSEADILVSVRPQLFALQDELGFLSNSLSFISQFCVGHRFSEDLLIFAQAVAVNMAYLLHFLRVDKKMEEGMQNGVKSELLDLLKKLNPLQQPELREIYLQALEGTNPKLVDLKMIDYEFVLRFVESMIENLGKTLDKANLEFTAKNQIEILREELISLKRSLGDLLLSESTEELDDVDESNEGLDDEDELNEGLDDEDESNEGLDHLTENIQGLIIKTGCFIYSSIFKDNKFRDLASDEIEGVKSEFRRFNMPQSWQSNFPKTNELECVDVIIKNLKEKLRSISAPNDPLATEVNTICKELLLALRDVCGQIAKHWNENEELKALFSRYRDVAYQAEYFVDSFICGVVPFWSQKMGLGNLVRDLSSIKKELKFILNDKSINLISTQAISLTSNDVLNSKDNVENTTDKNIDPLVGLKDEVEKIRDQIIGGSDQLTILSITGMPGIGKTTTANSVYKDPSVTMKFHARAWCSVSQVYKKENLLFDILHQVAPKNKEDHEEKNEKGWDHKLYQSLKGKKYLVVLDDIWNIEAWNVLRPSFPDNNNGSRIIFTARDQSIAKQANSVPHALRLLSDKESWKLLQVRVFKEENCPPELFQVGKKIAKNCKGLPLTVVLVAGLLKATKKKKDSWEQFANVLISHEVDYPSEQHTGILDLSYRDLPDYLRPCFLYFGSFPEDATIPVWKLVRLWIAEGFVQPKAGQAGLELQAENYLNALIDRSLVMIAKRSYNGRPKACHIHDLLHDFCTKKAREERFLQKIKRGDSLCTLTDSEVHEQYRLFIVQSNTWTVPLVRTGHFESRIRSLWFSVEAISNKIPMSMIFPNPYLQAFREAKNLYVNAVLLKFRLLRVLDLGTLDIVADNSFQSITQLVHLRYLSLRSDARDIPDEIGNLKNLETFLLTGTRMGYFSLPKTIWNMVNLKHIQIKGKAIVVFSSEGIENCNTLDGLSSLSTLFVDDCNELDKIMKKLPNIKKLKCQVLDDSKNGSPSIVLDFLHRLEELNITCLEEHIHIVFPQGLKKLSLGGNKLSGDEISVIGKLPNLEALKLEYVRLRDKWCMKEGEFKTLKFLKLFGVGIRVWDASLEHLPCPEELVVEECRNLRELPSIGESPFLRRIDLCNVKTSVVDSARKIEEEQYELGNRNFILSISAWASI